MSYSILLDARQKPGFYVLSHSGSLEDCRAMQRDPGTSWSLPKSEWDKQFIEPKNLTGPFGHVYTGEIAEFSPIAGMGDE